MLVNIYKMTWHCLTGAVYTISYLNNFSYNLALDSFLASWSSKMDCLLPCKIFCLVRIKSEAHLVI